MQKRVDGPAIRDRRQREKEGRRRKGGCTKRSESERARGVLHEGEGETRHVSGI